MTDVSLVPATAGRGRYWCRHPGGAGVLSSTGIDLKVGRREGGGGELIHH